MTSRKQRDHLLKTFNSGGKKFHSKFGASILSKYGWKEGQGLGKSEDGIKTPVSVKPVEGTSGIGSKPDEWHNWWDEMYDRLASKIEVKDKSSNDKKKVKKRKKDS